MACYLLSIVGQSNELGSATASRGVVRGDGAPQSDIGADHGSWWCDLAERYGRRGHWLAVARTALGSTSLVECWVGRCRAWQSGMTTAGGSYVLYGGNVYKQTAPAVTASGGWSTSTTAPAVGTGADGITWALARAATAADVDGAVYAFTDALYDPNGLIAAAYAALANNGFPLANRGVVVSIGQGDYTASSTRAQYAQAMQAIAAQFTASGYTVWLGMTCYMAGAAERDTYMTGALLPARLDALSALAGNPLVRAGADLRTSLGVLSVVSSQYAVGLQVDTLHLTGAAHLLASAAWDAALQAGGW